MPRARGNRLPAAGSRFAYGSGCVLRVRAHLLAAPFFPGTGLGGPERRGRRPARQVACTPAPVCADKENIRRKYLAGFAGARDNTVWLLMDLPFGQPEDGGGR